MTINVTGILVDPLSQPEAEVVIRVTALTSGDSLNRSEAIKVTDANGAYNFALVNGDFSIEVNSTQEYQLTGEIRVTSGMVGNFTLPDLLKNYAIPI